MLGLIGGFWSIYKYFNEQDKLHQKELDDRAFHSIDQLHRRFENQNLTYLLHQIKTYKKDVECELRHAKEQYYRELNGTSESTTSVENTSNNSGGIASWLYSIVYGSHRNNNSTNEEKKKHGILTVQEMLKYNPDLNWAEVWLHRRNNNDHRAKEIELCRVRTKASFYMLKQTLERHRSRTHLFNEFLYDDPLNKRYVEMFLQYVEPMDRARCNSHGDACVWERDEPAVFQFLRDMYNIDKKKDVTADVA